jgi:hypothetical protein
MGRVSSAGHSQPAAPNQDSDLSELPDLGRDIYALVEQRTTARIPNWQELLPTEAFDEPTAD